MRAAVRALQWAGLALLCLVACGSPLDGPGVSCSSNGDCGAGLACLEVASAPGDGCKTLLRVCSKPCKVTGDCAAVGPKFECTPTCNGKGTCTATAEGQSSAPVPN